MMISCKYTFEYVTFNICLNLKNSVLIVTYLVLIERDRWEGIFKKGLTLTITKKGLIERINFNDYKEGIN